MDKDHLTRYKDIHNFKAAGKGVTQDYSKNIKVYISSLQNVSYAVIKSTIHRSSKNNTSSNDTNISEMTSFRSASNITTEINAISKSNGPLIFVIDANDQKSMTSNKNRLTIEIADLIIL